MTGDTRLSCGIHITATIQTVKMSKADSPNCALTYTKNPCCTYSCLTQVLCLPQCLDIIHKRRPRSEIWMVCPIMTPTQKRGGLWQVPGVPKILANFANHRTLHWASRTQLYYYLYRYLVVMDIQDHANVIFMRLNNWELIEWTRPVKIIRLLRLLLDQHVIDASTFIIFWPPCEQI